MAWDWWGSGSGELPIGSLFRLFRSAPPRLFQAAAPLRTGCDAQSVGNATHATHLHPQPVRIKGLRSKAKDCADAIDLIGAPRLQLQLTLTVRRLRKRST